MTFFSICSNSCANRTLCMEKLSLVLPETPPYVPKQYGRCAVVGNSGDLLKTKFGKEIDGFDVVIRENGAPIQVRLLLIILDAPFLLIILLNTPLFYVSSFILFILAKDLFIIHWLLFSLEGPLLYFMFLHLYYLS